MTTKVSFTLPAEFVAGATAGVLVGEFNNWNPEEGIYLEKLEDGSMMTELTLTAGKTYQYRYLLSDGRWVNDHNAKKISELYGYSVENCLVNVPGSVEKMPKTKPATAKKKPKPAASIADDLTKIEGINKKLAALLKAAHIETYKDLSKCTIKKLQLILDGAGNAFSIHNPATWPKQAKLAATGKWNELSSWQEELRLAK